MVQRPLSPNKIGVSKDQVRKYELDVI